VPRNDTARTRNNTAPKASGPRTTPAAKWKSHNAHANVFGVSAKIAVHHSISRNTIFEKKATRIIESGINILIFSMLPPRPAHVCKKPNLGMEACGAYCLIFDDPNAVYDKSRTRTRLAIIL